MWGPCGDHVGIMWGSELYSCDTHCRALREDPELREVVISVDTYFASVAREAVAAGADIVNDVTGGAMDPDMLRQVTNGITFPCHMSIIHS